MRKIYGLKSIARPMSAADRHQAALF